MFSFTNGWVLLFLTLTPFFFYWQWRRRRSALRFPNTSIFDGLPRGRASRIPFFAALLRTLAVSCLLIAAAGPRRPDLKTQLPTESIAIMIVLDTSGSMDGETFAWEPGQTPISRKEAARRALHLFIEGGVGPDGTRFEGRSTDRGTDAIGLVTFSNLPHPVCPTTLNHSVLLHILDDARPPTILEEGSNIGDALAEGIIRLQKAAPKRKVIILLSDGELTFPDQLDPDRKPLKPSQAAQLAGHYKIPIYVIDTGGVPGPDARADEIKQREDARKIEQTVVDISGGKLFSANDGRELLAVCKTIDELERQPIVSHTYRRFREFYPWFAGVGLGLLLLIAFLESTRWRRLP